MTSSPLNSRTVRPWSRVAIMVVATVAAGFISWRFTGSIVPTSAPDALIFQSSLLFVILGSAIVEQRGNRPAESLVNALMGVISLVTVYGVAPRTSWLIVFGYCGLVLLLSVSCVVASEHERITGWRKRLADATYRPAVTLGRARLLFSVVFLYAVFSFHAVQDRRTAILLVFWGIFVALWPLGLPELLSSIQLRQKTLMPVGRVVRVDSPGIIRAQLNRKSDWTDAALLIYETSDGIQHQVKALYVHEGDETPIGTGLAVPYAGEAIQGLSASAIYRIDDLPGLTEQDVANKFGGDQTSVLIGFVIEESHIEHIVFESWRPDVCREGVLVWVPVNGERVYFQVTDGVTKEESLERNRHGFQCAIAGQLGTLAPPAGFTKFPWLPVMNSPVFCEPSDFGADLETVASDDFVFGRLPGTQIKVGGPFCGGWDHHTAILGVTGSGKTELAFDLIKRAVDDGIRVMCIDLTARYEGRLKSLSPTNLSISAALADELSEKMFEAETGEYGAGKEKKALRDFAVKLRDDVGGHLKQWLEAEGQPGRVGVISLDEISNTKASLFITEIYMSWLLRNARAAGNAAPRVLVVVEEAHTVMPETSTMGLGDYDSRGLVGKIAQIALQGRKYRVGLLVIAQRTATVSKTVLTQCNSIVALSCFDQTSVEFLSNVMGETHAKLITRLPRLQAVGFGKAFRSERPIVFEIPFDAKKAEVSS